MGAPDAAADGDTRDGGVDIAVDADGDVAVDAAVDIFEAVSVGGANPNAESDASMVDTTIAPRPVVPAHDRPSPPATDMPSVGRALRA